MGTHPIFESDFDCLTDHKFRMKLLNLIFASALASSDDVTCGSVLKLVNKAYTVRLHSHEVTYGSGSGQQSVTGFRGETDSNSYWWLKGADCNRGESVKCGEKIILTHINTMKNLHSHNFRAPLSKNQEVSAFGSDGAGDDMDYWTVVCPYQTWRRDGYVKLKHVGTQKYLSMSGQQYNRPISGQMEVVAQSGSGGATDWGAAEGVYVSPQQTSPHDEL